MGDPEFLLFSNGDHINPRLSMFKDRAASTNPFRATDWGPFTLKIFFSMYLPNPERTLFGLIFHEKDYAERYIPFIMETEI